MEVERLKVSIIAAGLDESGQDRNWAHCTPWLCLQLLIKLTLINPCEGYNAQFCVCQCIIRSSRRPQDYDVQNHACIKQSISFDCYF